MRYPRTHQTFAEPIMLVHARVRTQDLYHQQGIIMPLTLRYIGIPKRYQTKQYQALIFPIPDYHHVPPNLPAQQEYLYLAVTLHLPVPSLVQLLKGSVQRQKMKASVHDFVHGVCTLGPLVLVPVRESLTLSASWSISDQTKRFSRQDIFFNSSRVKQPARFVWVT